MTILDPVAASNLTVYLLQLPRSRPAARKQSPALPVEFLALEQAVAGGCAIIHFTSAEEYVRVENLSSRDLFIQAGELICCDGHDRAMAANLIVPARKHEGDTVRVPTFCVEEYRWRGDDTGRPDVFSSAGQMVPSRKLKLVLRLGTQDEVYRETARLSDSVIDILSYCGSQPTPRLPLHSLMERLEADWLPTYTVPLLPLADANQAATGAVFVVNGQFNSSELYATPTLFRQMWPKLLRATAVEALIEEEDDTAGDGELPAKGEVTAWLAGTHSRRAARHTDIVTKRTHRRIRSIGSTISFETLDQEQDGLCVHEVILSNE